MSHYLDGRLPSWITDADNIGSWIAYECLTHDRPIPDYIHPDIAKEARSRYIKAGARIDNSGNDILGNKMEQHKREIYLAKLYREKPPSRPMLKHEFEELVSGEAIAREKQRKEQRKEAYKLRREYSSLPSRIVMVLRPGAFDTRSRSVAWFFTLFFGAFGVQNLWLKRPLRFWFHIAILLGFTFLAPRIEADWARNLGFAVGFGVCIFISIIDLILIPFSQDIDKKRK